LATGLLSGHPVRPLFDGVGASTPYKWVRPPWYFGATNLKPKASETEIPLENDTSPLIGVNSDDAQIILNLPQGAVPAKPGDTSVRASFTPLDPKKLAKPPGTLRPDGNAYRVQMVYQPSNQPLEQTARPGNVIMVVPDEAEKMLYSGDGKAWEDLPTHTLGDPNTVGSAFTRPGYYLVGTALPEFADPNKGKRTKRIIGYALVVMALVGLFGVVLPTLLRRSRAAQARAIRPTRPVQRRKGPKGRKR
jgi:hypothetical protein